MADTPTLVRGLEGIPCAESQISYIDGQKGWLTYRGYTIEELSKNCTFEEVAYLLLYGELPTREELAQFDSELRHHRRLKYRIIDVIKHLPETGHPMDILQAGIAAMGMFYPAKDVYSPEVQRQACINLIAKTPTLVAAFSRLRHGDEAIRPRDDLGHAANFLYMLTEDEPDELAARTMDVSLILHAEHTMNASTFSARVVGSTLADPYAVISSAVGTLSGPLHGGANEAVLYLLDKIGSADRVDEAIAGMIERKEKIMGLGHRVYKAKDPRATVLQELVVALFDKMGKDERYEIARAIEQYATRELGHKGIYPNVDFYSGIVYSKLGIDTDLFTPIFAMARVSGWLSHWLAQLEGNRIFRPTQI
ncbi:MAG: citrate synthase, partial [Myxococcota bacterium]|nr:citrate synthase [Myxococcota bacterium]